MPSRALSLAERKVLLGVRFAARDSVSTLARRLGLRSHVVQRALKSLRDRGVLKPYVAVDVSKLGYSDYGVFFSVSADSAKLHRRLMQFLSASAQVPWVAELGGEYQYAFSLICKHESEVDEFLLTMGKAVAVGMTQRTVVTRTSWTVYPPRYLLPDLSGTEHGYEINSGHDTVKCDELDVGLLRQLSSPSGGSDAECARALGESVTTVRYRRNLLEKKGVIVSFAYGVDTILIGRCPYVFLVQVKTPSRALRCKLQAFAAVEADMSCLISCIGSWDYELSIDVGSPDMVAELQRRLLDRFSGDIVGIRTHSILKTHKHEPFPSSILAG